MLRILIIDDHILFRDGLASLLRAQPDLQVVGEGGDVREAIDLARKLKPDAILMDFSLPDGTGLDATQAILRELPDTKIVFLTMHEEDDRLFSAIRSGAKGYLLKNVPVVKLIASLHGLETGEAALSGAMTRKILEEFSRLDKPSRHKQSAFSPLTSRELEILGELARGLSNREIAERLFISENTVKNHVHNILEKLALPNRHEAVHFARQNGLNQGETKEG